MEAVSVAQAPTTAGITTCQHKAPLLSEGTEGSTYSPLWTLSCPAQRHGQQTQQSGKQFALSCLGNSKLPFLSPWAGVPVLWQTCSVPRLCKPCYFPTSITPHWASTDLHQCRHSTGHRARFTRQHHFADTQDWWETHEGFLAGMHSLNNGAALIIITNGLTPRCLCAPSKFYHCFVFYRIQIYFALFFENKAQAEKEIQSNRVITE